MSKPRDPIPIAEPREIMKPATQRALIKRTLRMRSALFALIFLSPLLLQAIVQLIQIISLSYTRSFIVHDFALLTPIAMLLLFPVARVVSSRLSGTRSLQMKVEQADGYVCPSCGYLIDATMLKNVCPECGVRLPSDVPLVWATCDLMPAQIRKRLLDESRRRASIAQVTMQQGRVTMSSVSECINSSEEDE